MSILLPSPAVDPVPLLFMRLLLSFVLLKLLEVLPAPFVGCGNCGWLSNIDVDVFRSIEGIELDLLCKFWGIWSSFSSPFGMKEPALTEPQ